LPKTLKIFLKSNQALAIEVCSLNEVGYPLTNTQRDLTTVQKVFLFHAYEIYNQKAKEETTKNREGKTSPSEMESLKHRLKKRQNQYKE